MGHHKHPLMQTQLPRCVSGDYRVKQTNTPHKAKQTNTPHSAKQPPHWDQGLALIPFVTTRTQPCRYCPLGAQRGPHCFEMRLLD